MTSKKRIKLLRRIRSALSGVAVLLILAASVTGYLYFGMPARAAVTDTAAQTESASEVAKPEASSAPAEQTETQPAATTEPAEQTEELQQELDDAYGDDAVEDGDDAYADDTDEADPYADDTDEADPYGEETNGNISGGIIYEATPHAEEPSDAGDSAEEIFDAVAAKKSAPLGAEPVVPAPSDGEAPSEGTIPVTQPIEEPEAQAELSAEMADVLQLEQTAKADAPSGERNPLYGVLFVVSLALLAADILAIIILSLQIRALKRRKTEEKVEMTLAKTEPLKNAPHAISVGKAHNIGARSAQQDSLGTTPVFGGAGILAIVADGMGGLSGGDQVSQRIVMHSLNIGASVRPEQMGNALPQMLQSINQDVNQMLGPEGLYKSGSTLLAVLATQEWFQWLSVGDSRIYLYRAGYMNQLNREHDLLQEWMPDILSGKMSYEEAVRNPDGRKLTSFIGMGKLRYADYSLNAIDIQPGDRILMMSDGVYNTLSEQQMIAILGQYPNVSEAAACMEQTILEAHVRGQDNFTVLILGF